jgi:hypothetical protein
MNKNTCSLAAHRLCLNHARHVWAEEMLGTAEDGLEKF